MIIVTFDPGIDAAWARMDTTLPGTITTGVVLRSGVGKIDRPDGAEIADLIADADVVVVEEVGPMPRQGVSSSFHFGLSFGVIIGAAAACGKQVHLVRAHVWKQHHRIKGPGTSKADDKKLSLALARQFWPGLEDFRRVKDHGRAEAALIALWYSRYIVGAAIVKSKARSRARQIEAIAA